MLERAVIATTSLGLASIFAFIVAILVSLIAWCCSFYYFIRTANNTVIGRDIWKRPTGIEGWFYNPLNRIFDSSQLTPDGLRYRHKLIWSLILFSAPILLLLLLFRHPSPHAP